MCLSDLDFPQAPLKIAIAEAYLLDETKQVNQLLTLAKLTPNQEKAIQRQASELVVTIREKRLGSEGLDAFLGQYDLSNEEGVALMCLAEALLRVPDSNTADQLIFDKLQSANWQAHAGKSDSLFVNAATWGLLLTGEIYQWQQDKSSSLLSSLKRIVSKSSRGMVRKAVNYAMQILGKQFVMGRTIEEALSRAESMEQQGFRFSYDMLGEAARTEDDATRYFHAYQQAIHAIANQSKDTDPINGPGISIKLSALCARYDFAHAQRAKACLIPKLLNLAIQAKQANMGLTVDAEEASRLSISLDIFEAVFSDAALKDWHGLGLAVQCYQKRALAVIDFLAELAKKQNKVIPLRLIKGAYWDTEIKLAQEQGLSGYPVYTRKSSTDLAYLVCTKKILAKPDAFYPQFATHNAYAVASVLTLANDQPYEFQCLHGMGSALYDQITPKNKKNIPCRVYAPVGSHEDLLAYLVRRLLENGANSSFVNRLVHAELPIETLVASPVAITQSLSTIPHPRIPLPSALYGEARRNSQGLNMSDPLSLSALQQAMKPFRSEIFQAGPYVNGELLIPPCREQEEQHSAGALSLHNPADSTDLVGKGYWADSAVIEMALASATKAQPFWAEKVMSERVQCLLKAADALEQQQARFIFLLQREAGKTLADAVAEVREAVDFCRYYAEQALAYYATPDILPGPTGELNQLTLHGRGVVLCISPWNFPLAIFTGQVVASLVMGNAVIAKPAEQTPFIAQQTVALLHDAGVPSDVLHCLPGTGEDVGAACVADHRVSLVLFTGSTQTAQLINQQLAARPGPLVPLIAETGGQNVMLVDSTALCEQVTDDVLLSAFGSAGQRCSALRVLIVQQDIAEHLTRMIQGSMDQLVIGSPSHLATDIGPVIDQEQLQKLVNYTAKKQRQGDLLHQCQIPQMLKDGLFFPPTLVQIKNLEALEGEVFGPVLHVMTYQADQLDCILEAINQMQYGLTLGIHSRINHFSEHVCQVLRVGNRYVNRSMTGAVVGVQPFGGEGLSGTGPKAGGPHYLARLAHERTLTINTTASGGNASLMSLLD